MAGQVGVLPEGTYGPGAFTVPERPIPGNSHAFRFSFDTTQHTNPVIIVDVSLEVSRDNGETWATLGAFRRIGGPNPIREGVTVTRAGATFYIEDGSQRRMRGLITITGGPLFTSAEFEWV